jgi:hypothetical protein
MNTPHKHAEVIKAWADGATVQVKSGIGHWVDLHQHNAPLWTSAEYRVKPEVTTTLSLTALRTVYYMQSGLPDAGPSDPDSAFNRALKAIANAAINQYIKEQSSDKEQVK